MALFGSRFNVVGINEFDSDGICTAGVLSSYRIILIVVLDCESIFWGASIRIDALSLEFVTIGSCFIGSSLTFVARSWVKF